jgi:hypothetical protein
MDETMLMEILNEIDAITPKEYWVLFNEAQKLPDFLTDWEPIPIPVVPDGEIINANISFSTQYKVPYEPLQNNNYFEGDHICLQAA